MTDEEKKEETNSLDVQTIVQAHNLNKDNEAKTSLSKEAKQNPVKKPKTFFGHLNNIQNTFIKPILEDTVIYDFWDVHSITMNSPIDWEKQQRILVCGPPNEPNVKFGVITEDFDIPESMNSFAMTAISQKNFKKKAYNYESYAKKLPDKLAIQNMPFEPDKLLLYLFENNLWKKSLDWLIDDTNSKDEVIVNICKSSIVRIPIQFRYLQRLNNHTQLFTKGKAGKTHSVKYVAGREPAENWSMPGLIGSFKDGKVTIGSLSKDGIYPFDEIKPIEDASSKEPIYLGDICLNIMEDGESNRDIYGGVNCKSTKQLIFMGNIEGTCNAKGFMKIQRTLIKNSSFDKFGRRFAHIIYSDRLKLASSSKILSIPEQQHKKTLSLIFSNMFKYYKNDLMKFMLKMVKLYVTEDLEYAETVKTLAKEIQNERIEELYEGNALASQRLKMGAVKFVIAERFPEIIFNKIKPKQLKNDVNNIYKKFCQYNIECLTDMVADEGRFVLFEKYIDDNNIDLSVGFVQEEKDKMREIVGVKSDKTLYNYLDRYRNKMDRLGIKRTRGGF